MRACAVKAVASFQISMTIQATNLVGHKQNKGQLHKLDNETGATLILYIVYIVYIVLYSSTMACTCETICLSP